MKIVVIAACDAFGAIGKNGDLAFKDKDDLRHFSDTTRGHTLIMGRKTYDSLPCKLKERDIVVISSLGEDDINQRPIRGEQVFWVRDVNEALDKAKENEAAKENPTILVAGGGQIYSKFLEDTDYEMLVDSVILTINDSVKTEGADTFFPKLKYSWIRKAQKALNNDCVVYEFVRR